jgi:hypothetical protein
MIILLFLSFGIDCIRAQYEFVQLFDTPLTSRETVTALHRPTKTAASVDAPKNGSLQLSVETVLFRSAIYRISDSVLDRASRLANGWRVSALLTVQHSGMSPDDASAPGDGFSFAYGEIPVAAEFFALSDDQSNCGSSAPMRKCVAVCHMTYNMDIRPLGIHVLLNRTTELIAPSLGEVLPPFTRRSVTIVVEFRPSTNVTSIVSRGLSRQMIGNFTAPAVPLNAWMFGTRTGTQTELVQLEHIVVSTLADQCKRVKSSCDANSIMLPLSESDPQQVMLCATINMSLPLVAENVPIQIRYSGHGAWTPHSGEAKISFVAADSDGAIYALSITSARIVWTLERDSLCSFIVRFKDFVESTESTFSTLPGWIPSFVAGAPVSSSTADAGTIGLTLPNVTLSPTTIVSTSTTSVSNANATTMTMSLSLQSEPDSLIAPIVGGVVGGVVLLLIILGVVLYAVSKRRKQTSPVASRSTSSITEMTLPPAHSDVIYTSLAATKPPIVYERGDAHIYDSGQIVPFAD